MTKPELHIAVFRHEYGVDCFTFYFVPKGDLKHPSPRKVAEHFNIDFEPEKGETFELVPANQPLMETLTAEQIGRATAASGEACLDHGYRVFTPRKHGAFTDYELGDGRTSYIFRKKLEIEYIRARLAELNAV